MTSGQRPEGAQGVVSADFWGKNIPEREENRCRGPEVGGGLVCLRNRDGDRMSEEEEDGRRVQRGNWALQFHVR